jgi:hypothetical protein
MGLTREDFLRARDLPREEVPVPELGDGATVFVRVLTAAERDELETMSMTERNGKTVPDLANIRARYVAFCACDETGQRLFTTADIPAIGALHHGAMARIADAAHRLNGLGPAAIRAKAKN